MSKTRIIQIVATIGVIYFSSQLAATMNSNTQRICALEKEVLVESTNKECK